MLYAIFYGILGGCQQSCSYALGISINEAGLIYVWPLALILALIHPHLMCFHMEVLFPYFFAMGFQRLMYWAHGLIDLHL